MLITEKVKKTRQDVTDLKTNKSRRKTEQVILEEDKGRSAHTSVSSLYIKKKKPSLCRQ